MRKKLSTRQQVFIVQCFARFMRPCEVIEAVKEEFGFEVSRQMVRHYDPTRGKKLAVEWVKLFEKNRAGYVGQLASIGSAHQSYRLSRLQEMMIEARKQGKLLLAAKLLEQAAKECGGMLTNKREIKIREKVKELADEENGKENI